MRKIKYVECPTCRQPMVDLSNDDRFVNHNPPKEGEKLNLSKKEVSKDSRKETFRILYSGKVTKR